MSEGHDRGVGPWVWGLGSGLWALGLGLGSGGWVGRTEKIKPSSEYRIKYKDYTPNSFL